jgi:putative glutathione S-transferase
MGQLIDGKWHDTWYDTASTGGQFVRTTTTFRNWITADGSPGPSGTGGFAAQAGRYHLYVSLACPWAHRTLIFRALKGLQGLIDISVVHPDMLDDGWSFDTGFAGATGDRLFGHAFMRDVYLAADPHISGRVTVPVLWDTATGQIVSNESAEIIRMFNSAFDGLTANTLDFWPSAQRTQIEAINQRIYDTLNNGVYKAGFATTQPAYDSAVSALFETMDWLESHLTDNRFLLGDTITEPDWRLFPTLVRFDPVYHGHFKCSLRRLVDYPNLWAYTRHLYQMPGIKETVNFDHIRRHYHYSHTTINPHRIVPMAPALDFDAPHGRD